MNATYSAECRQRPSRRLGVLRLLANSSAMTGADIARHQRIPKGTIYTILHRLEHDGLVRSELKPRRARGSCPRYYCITDLGMRMLELREQIDLRRPRSR